MVTNFKTFSIPLITNDTIPSREISLDSIKKLIPIGYYILTESGAKKSLKANIDAQAYFKKWTIADNALGEMSGKISLITLQRNQVVELNIKNEATIKLLSKQLFWANFWKWTAVGVTGILTTKAVLQISF